MFARNLFLIYSDCALVLSVNNIIFVSQCRIIQHINRGGGRVQTASAGITIGVYNIKDTSYLHEARRERRASFVLKKNSSLYQKMRIHVIYI